MRIAFASCSKIQAVNPQPAWKSIQDSKPDLLLLTGDFIYPPMPSHFDKMKDLYIRQIAEPNFHKLFNKVPHFLATWDDHDFGFSNGYGGERSLVSNRHRKTSRDMFLFFLSKETRRQRPFVYYSKMITVKNVTIKVILLDVRYYRKFPYRDLINKSSLSSEYSPSMNATLLGAKQENWLRNELKDDGQQFTLVCSGSCFSFGDGDQSWMNYGHWAAKFRQWVKNAPNPLFISGDIHANKFQAHPDEVPDYRQRSAQESAHTSYRKWLTRNLSSYMPAFNGRTDEKDFYYSINFFEIISSSVGRLSHGKKPAPRNNYGIMDITRDEISISFHGVKYDNSFRVVIDVNKWKVTEWRHI